MDRFESLTCPAPHATVDQVMLSHGGGGTSMHRLLEEVFCRAFQNAYLDQRHDAAALPVSPFRWAFTTDAFVVRPLFFPGGDIGSLAVYGTVNDLAMAGATPRYLSAAFILEEGFSLKDLQRIVASMQRAAAECGVNIVTGDTKVVDKGKGDGVYIATSGVGEIRHALDISPRAVRPGDAILVSGDLGRHGIAVIACREGLELEQSIESDCASLAAPALALLEAEVDVHCLRDMTRGGFASALNEIAGVASVGMQVDENAIPISEEVRGACELFGFDPLYVANEGRFAAIVSGNDVEKALAVLVKHAAGTVPAVVGRVTDNNPGRVVLTSAIGATRILDMLSGEQLPRIC